jgi:oxygen-independent coproporphyrinogen-3 oxidase
VAARHGATPAIFSDEAEMLEPLRRSGMIRFVGDRLIIMRDRPALARIVASAFDAYFGVGARHSIAA